MKVLFVLLIKKAEEVSSSTKHRFRTRYRTRFRTRYRTRFRTRFRTSYTESPTLGPTVSSLRSMYTLEQDVPRLLPLEGGYTWSPSMGRRIRAQRLAAGRGAGSIVHGSFNVDLIKSMRTPYGSRIDIPPFLDRWMVAWCDS